jgi:hypothetical protein
MSKIVRNYNPAPERSELRLSVATKGVEPLYAACVAFYYLMLDSRCLILDAGYWMLDALIPLNSKSLIYERVTFFLLCFVVIDFAKASSNQWRMSESNRRPLECKSSALAN